LTLSEEPSPINYATLQPKATSSANTQTETTETTEIKQSSITLVDSSIQTIDEDILYVKPIPITPIPTTRSMHVSFISRSSSPRPFHSKESSSDVFTNQVLLEMPIYDDVSGRRGLLDYIFDFWSQ
jgi:hypothetical protein